LNQPISARSRLAVSYRPVGELIADPRNARTHPKRQIDQLKASIAAFGFTNPILADPAGNIIAGHGRLQAARAMGFTEVPVIILPGLSESACGRADRRRFRGVEIDPAYVDVAIERWSARTGLALRLERPAS
jgi:ParB-like chromosome segregation protein Spo0J